MTAAERAELIELLAKSEGEMMQYIAGLSEAQWSFKPAPDRWSVGEVVVAPGRSYFDTNTGHHHHFYVEPDGELHDFPSDKVTIAGLPPPPKGTRLNRVDVIVRVRR